MKTTIEKDAKLTFQIKGIEIFDFELNNPETQLPPTTTFHFNLNIQHVVNTADKLAIVIVYVKILHEDKLTSLGNIKVSCIFLIENFDDITNQNDDGKIVFHKDNADILNSIALSTTRGVMFTCFRGTFLHSAVLPIIDPKSFKQE